MTRLGSKPEEEKEDFYEGNTLNIRFEDLERATYVVFYRYEWTNMHPERRAVISLYSPDKVELVHVDPNELDEEII